MHISIVFINLLAIELSLFSPTTEAQQPTYSYHFCSNTNTFPKNSTYEANRDSLLFSLSSNGIYGNGFNVAKSGGSPDMVYGLYLCRGDVSISVCQECVTFATTEISKRCPVQTTAVVWYDECLLRYSNQDIFSSASATPSVYMWNTQNVTEQDRFNQLLVATMNDTVTQAVNVSAGAKKFATKEATVSNFQTLYTLAQCTPDLSGIDCNKCLRVAIESLPACCSGKQGGAVLNPSCNVRNEIYPFYGRSAPARTPPPPSPPPPEEEKRNKSNQIPVLGASLSAIFGLAMISACGFFIWKRRCGQGMHWSNLAGNWQASHIRFILLCRSHLVFITGDRENSQEVQLLDLVGGRIPNENLREIFSGENVGTSKEFPSVQLDILDAATNHFSDENRLGEGGFGPVYKGTLPDGKEIAVKRLSRTSGQGLLEFKNEVMLIARLQHRHLVKLLGCCLEKNEKLLVYEFMPNRSLDVFLFDSNLAVQLDWQKRFGIIKGIARGILYLHEDSRLRIIHRDLKASNVLLDHEMNPKISDFGMARIFGGDKNEANTNRIVGTYGYMAPEYAMEGIFSIKSDVFSFGVLLLEIISGKKNNGFHLSESGESLLTFAWKLWSKGKGMELIDQLLGPSCVAAEVLKCIHIGLLCVQEDPADRPTMSSVIVMLASETITLPQPAEPAFSVGRVVAEPTQPTSSDRVFSVNEITISNLSPR